MADRGESERDQFTALYDEHYAAVLRYAARRVGAEAARDIAAETFLTAWRRLDSVPTGQPLPWLYATARHCLANELRRRERRERLAARIRTEAARGAAVPGPGLAQAVADRLTVLAALATLRPGDQEVLRLAEWERLDDAAAARVLGCSTGAFRVRLHRARRFARALDRQEPPGDGTARPAVPSSASARTEISAWTHRLPPSGCGTPTR